MIGTVKKYYLFVGLIFVYASVSCSPFNVLSVKKIAENFCGQLFGTDIASTEIQAQIKNARNSFNLQTTDQPPTKYITNNWLQKFSSFTWFGTWINKKAWNAMTEEEKSFLAHHEIAHEAKKHPLKQIGITAIIFLTSMYVAKKYSSRLSAHLINSSHPLLQKYLSLLFGMGSVATCTGMLISYIIKEHEKDADILAAQTLYNQGKIEPVQHHINELKKIASQQTNNSSSIWFKSVPEQINYLQSILKKYITDHE